MEQSAADEGQYTWVQAWEEFKDQSVQLAGAAFKAATGQFLRQLAYDTATYLATGDEGQKPMFITDGWGPYLKNAADNAAGTFLEKFGDNDFFQFNLCDPGPVVRARIGLGLVKYYNPRKPDCTFTEMVGNWQAELSDPNFLNRFQTMFNPYSSDLGIALTVYSGMEYQVSQEVNKAIQERTEGDSFKPVTEKISGYIKTPSHVVKTFEEAAIYESNTGEVTWTGTAADAIDVFINTLIGKLIEKWLKEGLVTNFPDNSYKGNWGGFTDPEAGPFTSGVLAARERFRSIIEPEFGSRGDYDILNELVRCQDPTKAGPTNCVITDNMREAISNNLTVGEAIDQGYLNPNGVFGFTSNGLEPTFNEGYPYRSMIIMRKFRIVPVGWEIAAQYLKDCSGSPSGCMEDTGGAKNLGDLVSCYSETDEYDGYSAGWCAGLVDPDWVLKAPQNFCRREGPGPEIASESIVGENEDSKRIVKRNDNYCADEQACIKEDYNGDCMAYGYCTGERRKWSFDGQSCDPINNTCQNFKSSEGNTVSYLENTLDFGMCQADYAGCTAFCTEYDFLTDSYLCTESTGQVLTLDRDAKECDPDNEGCHEFIRTKAGMGVNLLKNASFEEFNGLIDNASGIDDFGYWGNTIGDAVSGSYDGAVAVQLSGSIAWPLNIGPSDYLLRNESVSLSFYIKGCAGDFEIAGQAAPTAIENSAGWEYYQTSFAFPLTYVGNAMSFNINASGCTIDAIKLELGNSATGFSNYRTNGVVYERLAPEYLNCDGLNDPAECRDYVRQCSYSDTGCNLFTAEKDGMSVPAQVNTDDYCPGECVGYDEYLQKETFLDSQAPDSFIPSSAARCSSAAVGCDEFTNLDELGEGAENKEYYKYLRQCEDNANGNNPNCAEFYTWEGSAETGYQLRMHGLKMNGTGPWLTNTGPYNGQLCNSSTFNLADNPMCWEFYNTLGEVIYAFYPYTVTCSDDCHPYRRSTDNILPTMAEATSLCAAESATNICSSGNCASASNVTTCALPGSEGVFCKGGGLWRSDHQACIYQAVPEESVKCSAGASGCREYSGNTGNNMQMIFYSGFEGSTQDWTGGVSLSSESLRVGGESLAVNSSAEYKVGKSVYRGNSYVIQFIAKAIEASANLTIEFENITTHEISAFDGTAALGAVNWQVYELNLPELNHDVDDTEVIRIRGGNFYIDDIRLIAVIDRFYLRKNSWNLPEVCYEDILGRYRGADFNLGCEAYRDQNGNRHTLHDFSRLCAESAIGCEMVIDTDNYSHYGAAAWNDVNNDNICDASDGRDCAAVQADFYDYVVYDVNKSCGNVDKGCERLGEPSYYGSDVLWNDVYRRNNPDQYDTILCPLGADGCEEWSYDEGLAYFMDPGDQICAWRQPNSTTTLGQAWYKKQVRRCDENANGIIDTVGFTPLDLKPTEINICADKSDCAVGQECILDVNDYACPVSRLKTFGFGGLGNAVSQPAIDSSGNKWAGICATNQSGCTEYIDPVSNFNVNKIFNADFTQDLDSVNGPDGWDGNDQTVTIKAYTLYRFAARGMAGAVTLDCSDNINILDENNMLNPSGTSVTFGVSGNPVSRIVFSGASQSCTVLVPALSGLVELKEIVPAYELKQEIDKNSCNGLVDFENGCVLFNERAQSRNNKVSVSFDADLTIDDGNGTAPLTGAADERDTNVLIKSRPDRECDEWLACRSYIEGESGNNVCYDIGLCDSLDGNFECSNFVVTGNEPANLAYNGPGDEGEFANLTGYVKAGYGNWTSLEGAYYPFGDMRQNGEIVRVLNGNFELVGQDGYPMGWASNIDGWDPNLFKVIDNPVEAQNEGTGIAPEGNNFLKIGMSASSTSELISILPGTTYYLSAYMNTINLPSGAANIILDFYDGDGIYIPPPANNHQYVLSHDSGLGWEKKTGYFLSPGSAYRMKIILENEVTDGGNSYFDDIMIRPNLLYRTSEYTPQVCRLYPEEDALSCEYFKDSGFYYRGWRGYCLEYDRYPGSADTCLLWYPIDLVKGAGTGLDEGAGYSGRMPLFYSTMSTPVPSRTTPLYNTEACGNSMSESFVSLDEFEFDNSWVDNIMKSGQVAVNNEFWIRARADEGILILNSANNWSAGCNGADCLTPLTFNQAYNYINVPNCGSIAPNRHRAFAVRARFNEAREGRIFEGIEVFFCHVDSNEDNPCENFDLVQLHAEFNYTSQIVQTVTPVGDNKIWSARMYNGSDVEVVCEGYDDNGNIGPMNCAYGSDYPPFGSIPPIEPLDNPTQWDGMDSLAGTQPLFALVEPDPLNVIPVRSGHFVPRGALSRLFAESYGAWIWQSNGGQCDDGSGVCPNGHQCIGGNCQPSGGTVCQSGSYEGGACTDCGTCAKLPDTTYTCGGQIPGTACASNAECTPDVCMSPAWVYTCGGTETGAPCCGDSGEICAPADVCVGGVADGMFCSSAMNDCPGSSCSGGDGQYVRNSLGVDWTVPDVLCNTNGLAPRPAMNAPGDLCAILPAVNNILISGSSDDISIEVNSYANLTFNSMVDGNQMPLVMYSVDWGDGEKTLVSGVEMRDRRYDYNPHSLYHLYSYWDMVAKNSINLDNLSTAENENYIYCGAAGDTTPSRYGGGTVTISYAPSYDYCITKPRVKIKDNWGYCNNGVDGAPCPAGGYEEFPAWIVVTSLQN